MDPPLLLFLPQCLPSYLHKYGSTKKIPCIIIKPTISSACVLRGCLPLFAFLWVACCFPPGSSPAGFFLADTSSSFCGVLRQQEEEHQATPLPASQGGTCGVFINHRKTYLLLKHCHVDELIAYNNHIITGHGGKWEYLILKSNTCIQRLF